MECKRDTFQLDGCHTSDTINNTTSLSLTSIQNISCRATLVDDADEDHSTLCPRCASLRVEDLFKIDDGGCARVVLPLGLLADTLATSSCAFCRLIWSTRTKTRSWKKMFPDYFLVAVPMEAEPGRPIHLCVTQFEMGPIQSPSIASWDISYVSQDRGSIGLVDIRDGADQQLVASMLPVTEVPRILQNYSFLQGWLKECGSSHRCGGESLGKSSTWPENLVLISCKEKRLVHVESRVTYAALSYVWGPSTGESQTYAIGRYLHSEIPCLVKDAIFVAEQCGIEYLWVDRYCINQNDVVLKYDQIKQMDLIYSHAFMTIIDAAGSSPDEGLRGVSANARSGQPRARLGEYDLASTLSQPEHSIQSCRWNQRGWTYQEAFFSRRRIYFTQDQVYWECDETIHHESLNSTQGHMSNGFFGLRSGNGLIGKNSWQIFKRIAEYSRRALSYESDAINAFAGLLHSFEGRKYPVHNLIGIPVTPESTTNEAIRTQSTRFMAGLTWSRTRISTPSMHLRRRKLFPSWSWAGWQGEILYLHHAKILQGQEGNFASVQLEDGQGNLVDLDSCDLNSLAHKGSASPSRFIHIKTSLIPINVRLLENSSEHWIDADISQGRSGYGYFAVFENNNQMLEVKINWLADTFEKADTGSATLIAEMTGVILGDCLLSRGAADLQPFVLLLQDRGTYFERVGDLTLDTECARLFSKPGYFPYELTSPGNARAIPWHLIYAKASKRTVRLG